MSTEKHSQGLHSAYAISDEDRLNILVDTILEAIAEEEQTQ